MKELIIEESKSETGNDFVPHPPEFNGLKGNAFASLRCRETRCQILPEVYITEAQQNQHQLHGMGEELELDELSVPGRIRFLLSFCMQFLRHD